MTITPYILCITTEQEFIQIWDNTRERPGAGRGITTPAKEPS